MQGAAKESWQITIPPGAGLVLRTAGAELEEFVTRRLTGKREALRTLSGTRVVLGTAEMPEVRRLLGDHPLAMGRGKPRTRRIARRRSGEIVIAGSDERAVLDGVFSLEDWIWQGALPSECDKTWSDTFAARYFTNYIGESDRVLTTAEVRAGARQGWTHLGVNMMANTDDGSQFHKVVVPSVLPVKHDPERICAFQERTHALIALLKPWGIKPYFYLLEPFTGGLEDTAIPAEVKGRRFVNWMNKEVPTLCIRHPKVQEHYRALMRDFCLAYPEVNDLPVYMDDGDYWFCGPRLCPRCRPFAADPNAKHPMESYLFFANLLQKAAKEVRPDFSVGIATIHVEEDLERAPQRFLEKLEPGIALIQVPHHFDGVLCHRQTPGEWRNWARLAKPAGRRGVRLSAWDEFVSSETIHIVRTLPTVQATADKLKAYSERQVKDLFVEGPIVPGLHNPAYTVWRLMVTGEVAGAKQALEEATRRSYGVKAAPAMRRALASLEKGLQAFHRDGLPMKLYARWVLNLNPHQLMRVAITPSEVGLALKKGFFVLQTNGAKTAAVRHHLPRLLAQARVAEPYFAQAVALARKAVALALRSNPETAVALDHPLLESRSVGQLAEESLLALGLWQGLFKMWVNRMEAVQLHGILRVHAEEPLPYEREYRRNIRKPGRRWIQLARQDARNLRALARLVERTPDTVPHVIKWARDSENPNAPYAQAMEETADRTEAFLKDPWSVLETLWMA